MDRIDEAALQRFDLLLKIRNRTTSRKCRQALESFMDARTELKLWAIKSETLAPKIRSHGYRQIGTFRLHFATQIWLRKIALLICFFLLFFYPADYLFLNLSKNFVLQIFCTVIHEWTSLIRPSEEAKFCCRQNDSPSVHHKVFSPNSVNQIIRLVD